MQLEQRRRAMLQLHLSDQQFIAYLGSSYIRDLTVVVLYVHWTKQVGHMSELHLHYGYWVCVWEWFVISTSLNKPGDELYSICIRDPSISGKTILVLPYKYKRGIMHTPNHLIIIFVYDISLKE